MMYDGLSCAGLRKVYGRNDGCLDEVHRLLRRRVTSRVGQACCWGRVHEREDSNSGAVSAHPSQHVGCS
jgi:hypothetical protein